MRNKIKTYIFLILLSFCYSSAVCASIQSDELKAHRIKVFHPAISTIDSVEVNLIQFKTDANIRFYIDVQSVSCDDGECHVVPVRMHFNELGFYQGLELERRERLEKTKGKRFKKVDYQKLDAVIKKQDSWLPHVDKDKLVQKQSDLDGVDAVTSATTPLLPEEDYVQGAVWTCYTLWHWANGNLKKIIRDMVGDTKSSKQFVAYLKGSETYQIFTLEQVARRKIYKPEVVNEVLRITRASNIQIQNLVFDYLENADAEVYYASVSSLLETDNKALPIKVLHSLLRYTQEASVAFCENLSEKLIRFESYQEIDLALNFLEKYTIDNANVNTNVLKLLDRNNIVTGRRAYWFLEEKDLLDEQREKLAEFYETNSDYF